MSVAKIEYQWQKRGIKKATVLLYKALLVRQNGTCRLCPAVPGRRRLVLDFNKVTGEIRGLLCPACNLLVGQVETLQGNKEKLDQVIDYIAANGQPLLAAAESDIEGMNVYTFNPSLYLRQDRARARFMELMETSWDKGEAIREIAAELKVSTRTVRRYIGLP